MQKIAEDHEVAKSARAHPAALYEHPIITPHSARISEAISSDAAKHAAQEVISYARVRMSNCEAQPPCSSDFTEARGGRPQAPHAYF
jgi:hypothetical protein